MTRSKDYLTTGEAATIFCVNPDMVLGWIKSGDIPTIRTPGGHYRIHWNVFLNKMIEEDSSIEKNQTRSPVPFCWEYNSDSGMIQNEYKGCIVYKSRASSCFKLCDLTTPIGHAILFCSEFC